MTGFTARAASFVQRASWLARMDGPLAVPARMRRASRDGRAAVPCRYRGRGFLFRGCDFAAIGEVLIAREYAFLRPYLTPGCVVADIGAHIGLFALWLGSEQTDARILSVEASPATFAILDRNARRAVAQGGDWRALHRAAWRDDSAVALVTRSGETMGHHVAPQGDDTVTGITLAAVVAAMATPIDIMKIDIEGAEEAFLCGDPSPLGQVRHLVIELHPGRCDTARVEAVLRHAFRHVEAIPGRRDAKPVLFCRNAA